MSDNVSSQNTHRSVIFGCAWLYYMHGVKQKDIAKQLSVSRATVALYLRKARESGLVRVGMDTSFFSDRLLSQVLTESLPLEIVQVVPQIGNNQLLDIAAAAWQLLEPELASTSSIGVAWGEARYAFAQKLPRCNHPELSVMQLCGNTSSTPYDTLPDTSTFRIARQLGAEPRNLYAPVILSSATIAKALQKEPVIAKHLRALAQCEIALFSAGSCGAQSHIVTSGMLSKSSMVCWKRPRVALASDAITCCQRSVSGRARSMVYPGMFCV